MKKYLFLLLSLVFMPLILNAQVVGPGDWSSVRLYGHAFNIDDFSNTEYDWIEDHNYFFTIEKRHAKNIYGAVSSERASAATAAKIIANNSSAKPLFYWNTKVVYDYIYETIEAALVEHPEWNNDGNWTYEDPEFRTWFVDVVKDQVNNQGHAGVFLDGALSVDYWISPAAGAFLEEMIAEMPGIVIFNGFGPHSTAARFDYLEAGSGAFLEHFFRTQCNTLLEGKTMLDDLLLVPNDKIIIANGGPESTFWNTRDHKFSLAAFLIIANDNSYYHYLPTNDWSSKNLTFWDEDYGKTLGAPLGVASVNGYVYTRTFANASVIVDLGNKTSSITWVENPENEDPLNPDLFDISVEVKDDVTSDSITLATLIINDEIYTSNFVGEIPLGLLENQYSFILSKEGYDTLRGTLDITSDTAITLQLTSLTQYILSYKITDDSTNVNLPDVELTIDDKAYTTDDLGEVSLELYGDEYEYTLSKTGYHSINQSIALAKDTLVELQMDKESYKLGFQVNDSKTEAYISDVSLTINDSVYKTDDLGSLSLILDFGEYDYTLSKTGYLSLNQSINLIKDTVIALQIEKESFSLVFQVKDATTDENIPSVLISINDSVYETDALGSHSLVLDYGDYNYTISKDDYDGDSGSASLRKDTTLTILMSLITGINSLAANEIEVYPNPVGDVLTIELAKYSKFNYEIYNITGEQYLSGKLSSNKTSLDVSNLRSGIYLLKITDCEGASMKKFTKE